MEAGQPFLEARDGAAVTPVALSPVASAGARVAAAIGGTLAFLVATVVTVGFALVTPIGIVIARRIVRSRGRVPGLFSGWLGATIAATLAVLIVFGMWGVRSTNLLRTVAHAADSAAVAANHRPAGSGLGPGPTRVLGFYGAAMAFALMIAFLGAAAGSIGWAACLPLAFAITGRWRQPATPPDPLALDL